MSEDDTVCSFIKTSKDWIAIVSLMKDNSIKVLITAVALQSDTEILTKPYASVYQAKDCYTNIALVPEVTRDFLIPYGFLTKDRVYAR